MVANVAFLAALTTFLVVAWLAGELSFLAPYKAGLFRHHGVVIAGEQLEVVGARQRPGPELGGVRAGHLDVDQPHRGLRQPVGQVGDGHLRRVRRGVEHAVGGEGDADPDAEHAADQPVAVPHLDAVRPPILAQLAQRAGIAGGDAASPRR